MYDLTSMMEAGIPIPDDAVLSGKGITQESNQSEEADQEEDEKEK